MEVTGWRREGRGGEHEIVEGMWPGEGCALGRPQLSPVAELLPLSEAQSPHLYNGSDDTSSPPHPWREDYTG